MKSSLARYSPYVVQRTLEQSNGLMKPYVEALESMVTESVKRASKTHYRYLPNTRDTKTLHEYLTSIGFTIPKNDTAQIERFYKEHRNYLSHRGTAEGIRLLCWMVLGESPKIEKNAQITTPLRLNRVRVSKPIRVHSPNIAYVRIIFSRPLTDTEKLMLLRQLEGDRPVDTKYLLN